MKKPIKKVASKAKSESVASEYDQYGVCIACKGSDVDCLHQNLVQEGTFTKCRNCGCCV